MSKQIEHVQFVSTLSKESFELSDVASTLLLMWTGLKHYAWPEWDPDILEPPAATESRHPMPRLRSISVPRLNVPAAVVYRGPRYIGCADKRRAAEN